METSPVTNDKIVKRLRWIMVSVILFDILNTILGQPGSYWQHPETADEGNHLFRFFMHLGPAIWLSFLLIYVAVAFLAASIGCRRGALIAIFAYIFGHYYGASTWLFHRWQLGSAGFIVYGLVLGFAIVRLAFPAAEQSPP